MNQQHRSNMLGRHPWLMVVMAFIVLLGAWSALISLAVKNAPQSIEVKH
jgi:hypothetical protein